MVPASFFRSVNVPDRYGDGNRSLGLRLLMQQWADCLVATA